jgi:hypothetical protein
MSHAAYEPSDTFMTLVHAGQALADKGSSRLARRIDEAMRRVVMLEEAALAEPNKSERLVRALARLRTIITD